MISSYFHTANITTDTVIFGEAKYLSRTSAYSSALPQIERFINERKDIEDLPDLKPFCTTNALNRANRGQKGFAAAFSAKSTSCRNIFRVYSYKLDLCRAQIG